MKRIHVHVGVEDLANAIGFYSALFATQPAVVKTDYAKWMLDDPREFCDLNAWQAAGPRSSRHSG